MKTLLAFFTIASLAFAAESKIKMSYDNAEITKVLESYSKATGQKFVVDPGVRGRVSIFLQEPVTPQEAFNHLSSALALNGFAISKQGDTMIVKSARNIQRDLIEVSTERPGLTPQRMYTWIYTFKYISAEMVSRDLRILPSKDGEMNTNAATNQIIISDWVTNLNRIGDIFKEIDKKMDPETAKIVDSVKRKNKEKLVDNTSGMKKASVENTDQ